MAANSNPFRDMLYTTPIGEIKVDAFCRATLPGVYAAGDVSNVPYKQIVIAMGEGAKAALSAFDDRIPAIAKYVRGRRGNRIIIPLLLWRRRTKIVLSIIYLSVYKKGIQRYPLFLPCPISAV